MVYHNFGKTPVIMPHPVFEVMVAPHNVFSSVLVTTASSQSWCRSLLLSSLLSTWYPYRSAVACVTERLAQLSVIAPPVMSKQPSGMAQTCLALAKQRHVTSPTPTGNLVLIAVVRMDIIRPSNGKTTNIPARALLHLAPSPTRTRNLVLHVLAPPGMTERSDGKVRKCLALARKQGKLCQWIALPSWRAALMPALVTLTMASTNACQPQMTHKC